MDCKIIEHYGDLSKAKSGWALEFNLVEWIPDNGKTFNRYDIRHWSPDHSKAGKGVSFTEEEFAILKDLINR